MEMTYNAEIIILIAFVIFIPVSAVCYFYSRSDQRKSEIQRYMEILYIKDKDKDLFEQKHPKKCLSLAVAFVSILSLCFWSLILFGSNSKITKEYNYLLGNIKIYDVALKAENKKNVVLKTKNEEANKEKEKEKEENEQVQKYQNGALLTFNMAFLGAYLWGIQSIVRRYAMNDLIPVAYYSLGVRMMFSSILALVIYHLSAAAPYLLASLIGAAPPKSSVSSSTTSTHLMMPIFAFLIGMFPQRGLNWLTDKFSIFTQKNNPSVRDLPLMMIEGVTIYDRVRLQELGVDSCYDLANIDYVPYLFKTPYSPRVLINWILQAKLCVYFGEHVKALREHGIHTIWQFYNYKERDLKKLVKSTSLTEDTLILVKSLISDDKDIERLVAAQKKLSQYWNKEEDDTDNEEASDSKRDKDD